MLLLDLDAWWFLRASQRPCFRSFNPTEYDKATLIPKIRFTLRHLLNMTADDNIDGVKRLRVLLCGENKAAAHAFQTAKAEILQHHDPDNKLHGFSLHIGLTLSPPEWETREELQAYLRSVVELVEEVKQRNENPGDEFQFQVNDINLMLYRLHLDSVQPELRRLVSFGVPVKIHISHLVSNFHNATVCTESRHVYAALAQNPSPRTPHDSRGTGTHTLQHRHVQSTCELWSAVAFAPSLGDLIVYYEYHQDPVARVNLVKWLSYALRNGRLRSLLLDRFEPTPEGMSAFREIAESPNPARLLASSPQLSSASGVKSEVVSFKADAVINTGRWPYYTATGQSKTLSELGIETDWRLPVVATHSHADKIEFIVPGYAICSASLASVASIGTVPPTSPALEGCEDNGLHTLEVSSWYQHVPGLTTPLIELYGRSLRNLCLVGNANADFADDVSFDQDLEVVFSCCPHLETIELQWRRLFSLQSLARHYDSPRHHLRTIKLKHSSVPPLELVRFMDHLGNPRNHLSKTLGCGKLTTAASMRKWAYGAR